jgi:glycerol dehydrogenase-like iron-containing ADH family enzyme
MNDRPFPVAHDPAFLFGCGRFRMEAHLLETCAEEILRFGRHPLFVCDDNSYAVAYDKVAATLAAAGVELRELRHNGFCCRDDALAYAEAGALRSVDVVLGCGGGVICDFSKCLAHLAGAPLVTIPTSSAQCCAYTPIAVCYTREGRYVSTSHLPGEIAAALLDTTVLSRQPPRLLAAGAETVRRLAHGSIGERRERQMWHCRRHCDGERPWWRRKKREK